jgi:hypothetical protein
LRYVNTAAPNRRHEGNRTELPADRVDREGLRRPGATPGLGSTLEEDQLRFREWITLLLVCCTPLATAVAQSGFKAPANDQYVPQLGDIMNGVQVRHIKLWLAGKVGNWDLANYELRQLSAGITEAALSYTGIPVSNVTTMAGPLKLVEDAVTAKDARRFAVAFNELTQACNACHSSMGRGFVVIQIPNEQQPFANQLFLPPKAK